TVHRIHLALVLVAGPLNLLQVVHHDDLGVGTPQLHVGINLVPQLVPGDRCPEREGDGNLCQALHVLAPLLRVLHPLLDLLTGLTRDRGSHPVRRRLRGHVATQVERRQAHVDRPRQCQRRLLRPGPAGHHDDLTVTRVQPPLVQVVEGVPPGERPARLRRPDERPTRCEHLEIGLLQEVVEDATQALDLLARDGDGVVHVSGGVGLTLYLDNEFHCVLRLHRHVSPPLAVGLPARYRGQGDACRRSGPRTPPCRPPGGPPRLRSPTPRRPSPGDQRPPVCTPSVLPGSLLIGSR